MGVLQQILNDSGVFQYGLVDVSDIKFSQEVRGMCEVNTCQKYNKTWACPPAIGTVDECRERVQQYDTMVAGGEKFKQVCLDVDRAIRRHADDFLLLANEGCDKCKECTYPDAPCRFPEQTHGSLEGYGIFVSELAKQAGINYINGANTVTYFAGIACSSDMLSKLWD